jgi:hypothetical protein
MVTSLSMTSSVSMTASLSVKRLAAVAASSPLRPRPASHASRFPVEDGRSACSFLEARDQLK